MAATARRSRFDGARVGGPRDEAPGRYAAAAALGSTVSRLAAVTARAAREGCSKTNDKVIVDC